MINNIIFDLGGVIMDIHFHKCIDILKQHSCYFNVDLENPPDFFCAFEMGQISPHDFRHHIREYTKQFDITDKAIDTAWSSILGHVHEDKVTFIQELKQSGYKLYLLSNTNQLHTSNIKAIINQLYPGIASAHKENCALSSLFDAYYFSNEIGLRKPDADAFHHVMDRHQLKADETLFIDDLKENIKGAANVGLQTLHIEKEPFHKILPKHLER